MSYAVPFDDNNFFGKYLNEVFGNLGSNDFAQSYINTNFNQNTMNGWNTFSTLFGNQSNDGQGNWLKNQYGKHFGDYSAQAHKNPFYQWTDYLQDIDPASEYKVASSSSKGERIFGHTPSQRMVR